MPVAPRAFLSRHAPFDTFSSQALDRVENFLEMRFAARGETIFARESAPIDALWIVRKGRVRLERDGEVLEVVEPGECFGFPSLIANRAPERDAIAAEDVLLFRLPKAEFRRLLDEPGAARFFLEGLASRLQLQSAVHRRRAAPGARHGARPRPASARHHRPRRHRRSRGAPDARPRRRVAAGDAGGASSGRGGDRAAARGGARHRHRSRSARPGRGRRPVDGDRGRRDRLFPSADDRRRRLERRRAARAGAPRRAPPAAGRRRAHRRLHFGERPRAASEPASARAAARARAPAPRRAAAGLHRAPPPRGRRARRERRRRAAYRADRLDARRPARPAPFRGVLRRARNGARPHGLDGARLGGTTGADPADRPGQRARLAARRRAIRTARSPGGSKASRAKSSVACWRLAIRPVPAVTWRPIGTIRCRAGSGVSSAGSPSRGRRTASTSTPSSTCASSPAASTSPRSTSCDCAAGRDRHFLRALAREVAGWALPFGLFGALREGDEGFDLKRGSLLIVAIARLSALEAGSLARGTLERLTAAEPVLGHRRRDARRGLPLSRRLCVSSSRSIRPGAPTPTPGIASTSRR